MGDGGGDGVAAGLHGAQAERVAGGAQRRHVNRHVADGARVQHTAVVPEAVGGGLVGARDADGHVARQARAILHVHLQWHHCGQRCAHVASVCTDCCTTWREGGEGGTNEDYVGVTVANPRDPCDRLGLRGVGFSQAPPR